MDNTVQMNTNFFGRMELIGTIGVALSWMAKHFNLLSSILIFAVFFFYYIRERRIKERIHEEKLKQEEIKTQILLNSKK